jgi:hypothetical protein
MIRFRTVQDERLYLALRAEMLLRISRHLPPSLAADAFRNLGKIEALIHHEGQRQGFAAARIAEASGIASLPPNRVLFEVYGGKDTPLVAAEESFIEKLPHEVSDALLVHAWMDGEPMEFRPQTIKEAVAAYGDDMGVSAGSDEPVVARPAKPAPVQPRDEPEDDDIELPGMGQSGLVPVGSVADDEIPPDSPSFIDDVRGTVEKLQSAGWKPANWGDMVMKLHLETRIDAAFLDLQLSSDIGVAMLNQCGIYDLNPGVGVTFLDSGELITRT